MTPGGKMSAGMAIPLVIKFIPELNEDIFDVLPLDAETGRI